MIIKTHTDNCSMLEIGTRSPKPTVETVYSAKFITDSNRRLSCDLASMLKCLLK